MHGDPLHEKEIPMFRAKEKPITTYCAELFSFKYHGGIRTFDRISWIIWKLCFWRSTYAGINNSSTKTGEKAIFSIVGNNYSEPPSIPFSASKKEVNVLLKDYFKTITLEKELNGMTTANFFVRSQKVFSYC